MKNRIARITIAFFLGAFSSTVFSQGTIWYFADGAGLDFSGGAPAAIGGGASYSLDNSTTVSDSLGNLVFYSNGFSVWDANHDLMPNGSGLLGSNNSGQCVMAVHRPASDEFYLFTVDQLNGTDGLRYSVVDMALNGGLGDVTIKNQLLHTPSTERLEVVRNPNDGSSWLITHDWNNAQFRVYNLSSTGLDPVPVLTTIGSAHSGNTNNAAGQLTASPDGSMLVCGIYALDEFQMFDFDNTTGVLSNVRDLPGYGNAWGCAFSPDNTKLYLTKWYDNEVIQVDLSAGTWLDVQNSAQLVGSTTGNVNGWKAGYLQLGPDGKVYVAKFGQNTIGRIDFPDVAGVACGFVDQGVNLGPGICNAGLCRTATPDDGPTCALDVALPPLNGCAWRPMDIGASLSGIADTWSWDFGDGASSSSAGPLEHVYYTEGQYLITVIVGDSTGNCSDTAQVSVLIGAPETAGADSALLVCTTDAIVDLYDLLSPYADPNGSWLDSLGIPASSAFDPATDTPASFQYVISGVHCGPDTAWITMNVELCMALDQLEAANGLQFFPVPVQSILHVTLPQQMAAGELVLFDAQGKMLHTVATGSNSDTRISLDLTGLRAGTYLIRVIAPEARTWQRSFVKVE